MGTNFPTTSSDESWRSSDQHTTHPTHYTSHFHFPLPFAGKWKYPIFMVDFCKRFVKVAKTDELFCLFARIHCRCRNWIVDSCPEAENIARGIIGMRTRFWNSQLTNTYTNTNTKMSAKYFIFNGKVVGQCNGWTLNTTDACLNWPLVVNAKKVELWALTPTSSITN